MIRISQCMIVKNEEKNIEKALTWGKDLMWEQIVVDTGSTDKTVEIAAKLGAKIYHFPWVDDFAAAKNYAIEQALGDWIAFLDADEYMTPDEAGKIKQFLLSSECRRYDGVSTGWQQLDEDGNIFSSATQVRFFRNHADIRYRRRIHEQLVSLKGQQLRIADAVRSVSIFHTGYQKSALTEKKKNGRNVRLIKEELKEHPDDYEMLGYLGDEYYVDQEMKEAMHYYRRAIACMPEKIAEYDQRSAVTFTRLLTILTEGETASSSEAETIYRKAVMLLPQEADFDYIIGRYFAVSKEARKAIAHLENAIAKLTTYGCSNKALLLAANLRDAFDILVRCCYEAGEQKKCVTNAVSYLQSDRYMMSILSRLILVLTQDGNSEIYEQTLIFLSKIYDCSALKDRLFLLTAAEKSGCSAYAAYLRKRLFTSEELAALQAGKR